MKKFNLLFCLIIANLLSNQAFARTTIIGAGASFPRPFYAKAFQEYHKINPEVRINYQSVGSGRGIKEITNKTVDFGASDAFLSDSGLKRMPAEVVHLPMVLGGVALTFNVPGVKQLKLTPEILADIYLGEIKKWNDNKITKLNEGIKFPNLDIIVVHRSDSSGTTAIFTDYLSKVSQKWKKQIGSGKSLNWPTGLGGNKNDGVTASVKQLPGAIGYVEVVYALSNKLPFASIQNKEGNFIKPSVDSISLAANTNIPNDTRVMITNTSAKQGYPIAGFTWIIIYKEQKYGGRSMEQAQQLIKLLKWMITSGQQYAKQLKYGVLPQSLVEKAETVLKSVTYDGKPL